MVGVVVTFGATERLPLKRLQRYYHHHPGLFAPSRPASLVDTPKIHEIEVR